VRSFEGIEVGGGKELHAPLGRQCQSEVVNNEALHPFHGCDHSRRRVSCFGTGPNTAEDLDKRASARGIAVF
jgi:hypothetical protein